MELCRSTRPRSGTCSGCTGAASARPDLTLLAQVAGAVAVLENRPEDLAAVLHDELAIAIAAVTDRRPELAAALARLRPHSPVLAMALRHPALRPSACAALANHLDDEEALAQYLVLLRHPEGAVVKDALSGLAAFRGLRPTGPARARAVTDPAARPDLVLCGGPARPQRPGGRRGRTAGPGGPGSVR